MATYIISGGATGIGAATRQLLQAAGHQVISVDIKDGDVYGDLGDPDSREAAIRELASRCPAIDGLITCAGVASHFPDPGKILAINYFGTRRLIEGLRPNIRQGGRVVAISSNSAPMCQSPALIDALLANDETLALELAQSSHGHDCYAGSKQAVARWMRSIAPTYAQSGIAFNAVAPGYIETPMTAEVAASAEYGEAIKQFVASIPIGRPGQPVDVARLIEFLLSPAAGFIAGSLIFCDGAHDALMRPDGLF